MAEQDCEKGWGIPGCHYSQSARESSFERKGWIYASGRDGFRTPGLVFAKRLWEVKGIADTGFLVAFANRSDFHHDWAVKLGGQVSDPLLTCDAVLAETAFHLGDTALVLEFVRQGLVSPTLDVIDHLPRLLQIARRFEDQKPDLADICLIRLSELYPQHSVITTDVHDFRMYRRNRREVIPLIVPPQ